MKLQIDPHPARLRHAQHYIALAYEAQQQFLAGGNNIGAGLALFDRERANLDAARSWLQAHAKDDDVDALLIADADATVYIGDLRYSKQGERIPQMKLALGAATRHDDRETQGRLLGNLGVAYATLGEARQAIEFYQQSLTIMRELGRRRREGEILGNLGLAYAALGETRQAIEFYQQSLTIMRELGDRRSEGNAVGNLGNAYGDLGDTRTAIEFHQQHLAIARELGDRRGEGNTLGNLGIAYFTLGNIRQAIEFYQQTLTIMRELGDRRGEGNTLGNLGSAYFALGEARTAIEFHQQYLALARKIGDRRGEGMALGNLGSVYADLGDVRQAIEFYQQHLALARKIGNRRGEAETAWNLGRLLVRQGETPQALEYLEHSLAFYHAIDHPRQTMIADTIAYVRAHGVLPETQVDVAFDDLSEVVRQALADRDDAAFQAALAALPEAERAVMIERLEAAGILRRGPDMNQVLREFHPLLRDIAAIARGDDGPRAEIEIVLSRLEEGGWQIVDPVQRLWAGERDEAILVAHIDASSAILVRRVLELIDAPAESHNARSLDTPQQGGVPAGQPTPLPESVQAALATQDPAALEATLAALPAAERTRVEALLQQAYQWAIVEAQRRPAQDILDGLPPAVRAALERNDQGALQNALATLSDNTRQRALADLWVLQTQAIIAAQQEQQRDPRERFAPLLNAIAIVAAGDDGLRQAVAAELGQLQQNGWMLRAPVERIWAGKRDHDALVAGLDAQDTLLIERVLALLEAYERGERRTPAEVLALMPEAVRQAIAQQDQAAFKQALAALSDEERRRYKALLAELRDTPEPQPLDAPNVTDRDERAALLATLPDGVRAAIERGDGQVLGAALAALPKAEARVIVERLQAAGIIAVDGPQA